MTKYINLATLKSIFSLYEDSILSLSKQLTLPRLPYPLLARLLSSAEGLLKTESTVLRLTGTVVVVGDLHGHLPDLLRILREVGCPPRVRYLFLGDLVDRGEFSTETVVLILTMKLLWPESVFVIRGNHEFPEMWAEGGFGDELERLYPSKNAGLLFARVFSMLPMAAIVNGSALCVHGGIGPATTVTGLSVLTRPLTNFEDPGISDVVWSDPTEQSDGYWTSPRGLGCLYGGDVLDAFLRYEGMTLLVRGHEAVEEGCLLQLNGRVLTVFSASAYCDLMENRAGIAIFDPHEEPHLQSFPPLRYICRSEAVFVRCDDENDWSPDSARRSGSARKITRPQISKHRSAEWRRPGRQPARVQCQEPGRRRRRSSGGRSSAKVCA
jgi:protein phosphatase